MSQANETVGIKLNDVIQLVAPEDPSIDNVRFMVDYLDPGTMVLVPEGGGAELVMGIGEDGELDNPGITEIDLLDRNDVGYAREHGLVPGAWVNIFFGGDLPITVTGEITNLEQDMIEVKRYPEGNVIYLNFDYKGIPRDLDIERIAVRDKPLAMRQKEEEEADDPVEEDEMTEYDDHLSPFPIADDVIHDAEADMDDIVFGDTLEQVEQVVDLPESQQRFGLETQANNLLDHMLSAVPAARRTPRIMNRLHLLVQRFTELRREYSEFDEYGNAEKPLTRGIDYKPLAEPLLHHKIDMPWILPVVKMKKKIYDVKDVRDDDYADIVSCSLAEDFVDMLSVIDQYKANAIPGNANSTSYLYDSLNPYLTPFVNDLDVPHVNARPVAVSRTGLSDNQPDYMTSVRRGDSDGKVDSFRLFQQRYVTGLDRLVPGDHRQDIPTVGELTEPDTMVATSYITMPRPVLEFSKVQLPSTSIMTKSALGLHYMDLWRIMNRGTRVRPVILSSVPANLDYEAIGFSTQILHYVPDTMDNMTGKEYIDNVLPTSQQAFSIVRDDMDAMSFHGAVHAMSPFLVYEKDIHYGLGKEINAFVRKKQHMYKKDLQITGKQYDRLKTFFRKSDREFTTTDSPLMNTFDDLAEMRERVGTAYGIMDKKLTSSEILRSMLYRDSSRLYGAAISAINAGTSIYVQGADKIIEKQLKESSAQIAAVEKDDRCKRFRLSKKYTSIDQLKSDDDKPISYDKEYDDTNYNFLKPYESGMLGMDKSDWFALVVTEFMKAKSVPARTAVREVKRMIDGTQKVLQGDYAVLGEEDKRSYWKRTNDKWVKDQGLSSNGITDESKMFCNVQESCVQTSGACSNMRSAKFELKKQLLQSILLEFSTYQDIASENDESTLMAIYESDLQNIRRITKIKTLHVFKSNDAQIRIGEGLEKLETTVSPHARLRDRILGQADFATRQYDISRFANEYTRAPEGNEAPTWLYCTATNVKLLPAFLQTLSAAYMEGGDYTAALNEICTSIGAISGDGGTVVDKYSGYTIKDIPFSDEEGYTASGMKDVSRADMEHDLGQALMGDVEVEVSPDTAMIINIITTLSKYIGVSLTDQRQFIINHATDVVYRNIESEEAYAAMAESAKKRGKKIPTYEFKKNNLVLMVTCSYVFVSIQLMIPPAKTSKTFPNCRKAFGGYPLERSDDNVDGLLYIACVMSKLEKSVAPWDTIRRTKQDALVIKMKAILDNFVLVDPEVADMYEGKRKYLRENRDDDVPVDIDIERWYTFLPPLKEIVMSTVQPTAQGFLDSMLNDVKDGKWEQMHKMAVCRGKIIHLSIFVMKLIQDIIEKARPILMNVNHEPFMDNVCCNEAYLGVIQYLNSKDASIMKLNTAISVVTNYIFTIQVMQRAKYLFDPLDTKQKPLAVPVSFSETVIYQAFIVYCKYNQDVPLLNEQLLALCENNTSEFEDEDDLEARIDTLKSEGKIYSEKALTQLMRVVNRANIIHEDFSRTAIGLNAQFRAALTNVRDSDAPIIPLAIVTRLFGELDTFDIATNEESQGVRELKNLLHETSEGYSREIRKFLLKHGRHNLQQRKRIDAFLGSLDVWSFSASGTLSPTEAKMFNMTDFLQNFIENIAEIYPTSILHRVSYNDTSRHITTWESDIPVIFLPGRLNVSSLHEGDLHKFIKSYYADVQNLYSGKDGAMLDSILRQVVSRVGPIREMAACTPRFTEKMTDGERKRHPLDIDVIMKLYKFYVLAVLRSYIHVAAEVEPGLQPTVSSRPRDATEAAVEGMVELEMIAGDVKNTNTIIADLIIAYTNMYSKDRRDIALSYDEIMEKVLRSKEKEKDEITTYLKDLTDEEREIENIHKNNKLGQWGVGLTRSVVHYDADAYDKDRDKMEKRLEINSKLGRLDAVDAMHLDIFELDMLESDETAREIENEELDMSNIPDDDDADENDGY